MSIIFFSALILYLLVFIIIGILEMQKIHNFTDFSAAGKNQGTFSVVMTLLATVVGASTTIGITDTVYKIGFPGIWWLAFGALGLIMQSLFISERVRKIDAITLPDLAGKTVGRYAEMIIAVIIVISWIGVIAGQFAAMNSLITFALGRNEKWIFVFVVLIVIIYTMIGGQMSVVKSDKLQLAVIFSGVVICMLYLYFIKDGDRSSVMNNIMLLNDNYRPVDLFTQFFVIGGVYFLGPDIMSRNFISKNGITAKRSAGIAGIVLFMFSVVITMTGMWLRYNITPEKMGDSGALMYAVSLLPEVLSLLLIFGLLSAILSSTDTCLINASAIFVKDILRKDSITGVRITVIIIGALALGLVLLGRGDIMSLLTGAYSIYTPGVIFPLTVAILAYAKHGIRSGFWLAGVIAGGICGLAGTFFSSGLIGIGVPYAALRYLTLIGMGISLVFSLISVRWKDNQAKQ